MKITPDHKNLRYSGRIDFTEPKAPVMVYPCSFVALRFTGMRIAVTVENHRAYWDNYIGYILDGTQYCVRLKPSGLQEIVITSENTGAHELLLFKRMDACHHLTIRGFELDEGGVLLDPPPASKRRMEVYGDSVSAGEVSVYTLSPSASPL